MSDPEQPGDPGFDRDDLRLALDAPGRLAVRRPVLGTFGPSGDQDSDFGYDQAHEG